MKTVKLFVKQYCPNCMEVEALLKSQNYQLDVIVVDHLANQNEYDFGKLPLAIFDNTNVEGLAAIKQYVAIEQ